MLTDPNRQRLDGIVQQMTANKEPDTNIQAVVNDFKTKYDSANGAAQLTPPVAPPTPDQQSAAEYKPTFAANTVNPGAAEALKTVGNVPSSTVNFAKGAVSFLNPVRSVPQALGSIGGIASSIPGAIQDSQPANVGGAAGALKTKQTAAAQAPIDLQATQAAGQGTTATSLLNPVTAQDPSISRTAQDTLTGTAKGIFDNVVPQSAQELMTGDTKGAQRTITNDPVGQIAPFLLAANEATGKGGAVDSAISKTGKVVTEPVKALARKLPGMDILTKAPEELRTTQMTKGFEEQNSRLKSADNAFNNNTKNYSNPDGTTRTVTPIDTLAANNAIPQVVSGKLDMGNYKTGEGVLGQLKTNIQNLDTQIDQKLESTGKQLDIEEMRNAALDEAKKNPQLKRAGTVQTTINKLNTRFDDYKQSYGDKLDIKEVNAIRKVANQDFSPESMDASRIVGDTTRNIVYNATEDKVVQHLLQKQGELLAARNYADTVHGTAVTGGRLGNYAMRQVGATIGATLKGLPIAGPILGALGGDALANLLQQSQFRSFGADAKVLGSKLGTAGGKVVQGAKDINEFKKSIPVGLSVEDVSKQKPYQKNGKVYIPGQPAVPINRYTPQEPGAFPKRLRQGETLSADELFQPRPVLKRGK